MSFLRKCSPTQYSSFEIKIWAWKRTSSELIVQITWYINDNRLLVSSLYHKTMPCNLKSDVHINPIIDSKAFKSPGHLTFWECYKDDTDVEFSFE